VKIVVHVIVDLGRVDEERGAIKPDEKVAMEERVIWDIRATKVESIR
jgi:hypothetical protein